MTPTTPTAPTTPVGPANPTRAFTLVECLAVVALLALAIGTMAVGLGLPTDAARVRESLSLVLDADARARAIARGGTPVHLSLEERSLTVRSFEDRTILLERSLPATASISLGATNTVFYDSAGRCEDFAVRVRVGPRREALLVCGITGWAEPTGSAP